MRDEWGRYLKNLNRRQHQLLKFNTTNKFYNRLQHLFLNKTQLEWQEKYKLQEAFNKAGEGARQAQYLREKNNEFGMKDIIDVTVDGAGAVIGTIGLVHLLQLPHFIRRMLGMLFWVIYIVFL